MFCRSISGEERVDAELGGWRESEVMDDKERKGGSSGRETMSQLGL